MTSHSRKHMRRMLGKNFDKIPNQGPRSDDALGSVAVATGSSAMSSTPNMMDTETDEYMDYAAGTSPAGLSSESSVPDRSCTSTPIGNESSAAGYKVTINVGFDSASPNLVKFYTLEISCRSRVGLLAVQGHIIACANGDAEQAQCEEAKELILVSSPICTSKDSLTTSLRPAPSGKFSKSR
eukprot:g46799.t1